MNKQEAQEAAKQLIELTKQKKQLDTQVRKLRQQLIDFTDEENLLSTSWQHEGSFVEVDTQTKYKLVDLPAKIQVPQDVMDEHTFDVAIKPSFRLSKLGNKMFKQGDEELKKLMIPSQKKAIKVII